MMRLGTALVDKLRDDEDDSNNEVSMRCYVPL